MEITFKNISGHVTIKIYIKKNIVNNVSGHVNIKIDKIYIWTCYYKNIH